MPLLCLPCHIGLQLPRGRQCNCVFVGKAWHAGLKRGAFAGRVSLECSLALARERKRVEDTKLQVDESHIARKVRQGQSRVLVERLYASALIAPLGIFLVAWLIFLVDGWRPAVLWSGLMVLCELLVVFVRALYVRAVAQKLDAQPWVNAMIATAGILGLAWGSSVWFVWSEAQFLLYITNLCVLVGVSGIVMAVVSPLKVSTYLFVAGMAVSPMLHLLVVQHTVALQIGVGWLVMVAVQTGYARELRRELAQLLGATERNGALVGLLTRASKDLKAVNAEVAAKNVALQNAMDKLSRTVTTDHLTGAYTRRYIFEQMERQAASKTRHGTPVSLVMLDLDYFKSVNDRFGHPVGDRALRAVADAIRGQLREGDLLARMGGEEFLVLLPVTDQAAASLLAERLRVTLAGTSIEENGEAIYLPASFGVAELHANEDFTDWYRRVDSALYQAKNQGRNSMFASL